MPALHISISIHVYNDAGRYDSNSSKKLFPSRIMADACCIASDASSSGMFEITSVIPVSQLFSTPSINMIPSNSFGLLFCRLCLRWPFRFSISVPCVWLGLGGWCLRSICVARSTRRRWIKKGGRLERIGHNIQRICPEQCIKINTMYGEMLRDEN